MKGLKRISALVMASIILLTFSSACKQGNDTSSKTSSQNTSSSSEVTLPAEEAVDMNGYEFVLASAWIKSVISKNPTEAETLFFDSVNRVQEKYNCKIKIKSVYADSSTMLPKIMAGDKIADVVEMMPDMWLAGSSAGYIVPWDSVEGINVNDPRWISGYTKLATYNNKHWGLQYIKPAEVRTCMYYNKDLLKANGIKDDPADLVKAGTWTFDKFREFSKACTKDTNNDGNMDTFGLLSMDPLQTGYSLIWANGGNLCTLQDGKVKSTFDSKNVVDALNFYDNLVNTDKAVKLWGYERSDTTWNNTVAFDDIYNFFREGKAAFLLCDSWVGNQQLKPYADNISYGMVPLPKGPAATDYISPAQYSRVFTMTSTNKDAAKSAIIFNALAYPVSEDYVGDEWWLEDIQNEYFQDNDTKSSEMYKLCLDKSKVDLGIGVEKLRFDFGINAIAASVFWKTGTVSSQIDAMSGVYDDTIAAIYKDIK